MTENLNELRKTAEAATPGPWHWAGNADNHQLYLATWIKGAGRCQVMDFERWGMQGAIPRFLDDESLMMQTAKNRLAFEVARNQGLPDGTPRSHPKVYRADVVDVMHPNAEFIATFDPPTVLALIDRVEAAEQALDFHAQRDRELKTLLSTRSDRLDEFSYDELSSLIEDEPMNQWGESYTSKLQAAEAECARQKEQKGTLLRRATDAEQQLSRVRDMAEEMGEGKAFGILARGREDEYPISYFIEMLEEALDGGEPNE